MPHTSSALGAPITEDDIADYLLNTPAFFERHAELLSTIQFSSPHGGRAIGLQERQAALLRDKIKQLELRIMDMIRNVNDNMVLTDKLLQWARGLFMHANPATLPDFMASSLAELFAVPQVGIKVWDVDPAYGQADWAQGVSDDTQVFVSSLTEPFCGVNTGLQAIAWLPEPKAVASLAILPLRPGVQGSTAPAFGMLVLTSPDPQRFSSALATDFLSRLTELASAALSAVR
ncbi:MAG: DUF484 family protein [Rhodoferax sp.]